MNICLEAPDAVTRLRRTLTHPAHHHSPVPCGQAWLVAVERCSRFPSAHQCLLVNLNILVMVSRCCFRLCKWKKKKLVSRSTIICFHLNKSVSLHIARNWTLLFSEGKVFFCCCLFFPRIFGKSSSFFVFLRKLFYFYINLPRLCKRYTFTF